MTTLQFVFAACLFLIQGVYSQSPAPMDPAWATEELRCGLWLGHIFNVKYYQGAYGADVKHLCAYFYFRDILSAVYLVILAYMTLMFAMGYMPKYFDYIQLSLSGLMRCVIPSKRSENTCCSSTLVLLLFFGLAVALILISPEAALLYHVIFDLFLLGGSQFPDCGICGCCISDVKLYCCGTVTVDNDKGGNVTPPREPIAGGKPPEAAPASMFHDPLNLRPRIQYVTKYKPVPMGPSIA